MGELSPEPNDGGPAEVFEHPRPLRLAVGPFSSEGKPFQEFECEGERIAESRSEGTRAFWKIRSQPSMYVVRTLYRLVGIPHFAVHAVLFSLRDHRPKLARVEAYPEWEGLVQHHADLAREVPEPERPRKSRVTSTSPPLSVAPTEPIELPRRY